MARKISTATKVFRFVLLLVLLLVATTFYGWRELGKIIDAANRQLPDGLSMSYEQHRLDLEGRLVLVEPKLYHNLYGLVASGSELRFSPQRWQEYFSLYEKVVLRDYPEIGLFEIPELTLYLEDLARLYQADTDNMLVELLSQGCGEQSLSLKDLSAYGINQLQGSFELEYRFKAIAENLKVSAVLRLENFIDFESKFELNNASANSAEAPYLVTGQWGFYNAEFLAHRDEYCAALNQQSIAEFQEIHITAVAEFMRSKGVNLDQNMVTRYADFVAKPETAAMMFQPVTGVPLPQFNELDYSDLVSKLGATLSLNAQVVEPMIESLNLEVVESLKNPDSPDRENQPKLVRLTAPNLASLADLGKRDVLLTTVKGNTYKGQFVEFSATRARFRIRAHGGYATLLFEPEQIGSVEYLQR